MISSTSLIDLRSEAKVELGKLCSVGSRMLLGVAVNDHTEHAWEWWRPSC